MQRQDVLDTSVSIIHNIITLVDLGTGNIEDLYKELSDKTANEILFHSIGIIGYCEHAMLMTPNLHENNPEIERKILLGKSALQTLLIQQLLMTADAQEKNIARLESKIDTLLLQQQPSVIKSSRWGRKSAPTQHDENNNLRDSIFRRKR